MIGRNCGKVVCEKYFAHALSEKPSTVEISHVRIECVMFQLQGSIIIASVFEVIIGFTGVIGLLMRFIGPLTIVPTISLTGLSLFGVASFWASKHWGIAVLYVRRCFIMISNYINESELFLLTWKFSPG